MAARQWKVEYSADRRFRYQYKYEDALKSRVEEPLELRLDQLLKALDVDSPTKLKARLRSAAAGSRSTTTAWPVSSAPASSPRSRSASPRGGSAGGAATGWASPRTGAAASGARTSYGGGKTSPYKSKPASASRKGARAAAAAAAAAAAVGATTAGQPSRPAGGCLGSIERGHSGTGAAPRKKVGGWFAPAPPGADGGAAPTPGSTGPGRAGPGRSPRRLRFTPASGQSPAAGHSAVDSTDADAIGGALAVASLVLDRGCAAAAPAAAGATIDSPRPGAGVPCAWGASPYGGYAPQPPSAVVRRASVDESHHAQPPPGPASAPTAPAEPHAPAGAAAEGAAERRLRELSSTLLNAGVADGADGAWHAAAAGATGAGGAPPRAWRDYFSLAADGAGGAALLPLTEPAFCKALSVSNSAGKKAAGAPPRKRSAGTYGRRRGAPDYGVPARSSSFERGAGRVAHKHRG